MTDTKFNRAQPASMEEGLAERPDGSPDCGCPIVFACDGSYAMQLATALRSLTEATQHRWPLDIHVRAAEFSDSARRKVLVSLPVGSALIRWVAVDLEPFREFSTWKHNSKITFARLLIPRLFPETVSRILYLDADLLVFDDLGPLWKTDLEGAVLGAVLDGLDPFFKDGRPGTERMPRVRDYFNAGVPLIDLPRWLKARISAKALDYLTRHPRSPFSDQDALNVACDGHWKKLDPRWNFQNHYETNISDMAPAARPAIVHFVTSLKPWKPSSVSVNAALYDAFRSRTCFARARRDQLFDAVQTMWFRLKRRLRRALNVGGRSTAEQSEMSG